MSSRLAQVPTVHRFGREGREDTDFVHLPFAPIYRGEPLDEAREQDSSDGVFRSASQEVLRLVEQ